MELDKEKIVLKARNRVLVRQLRKYEYLLNFLLAENKLPFKQWLQLKHREVKNLLKKIEK